MRIDYIKNMKDIYRREKAKNYRRTVIFFFGLAVLAYLGILTTVMLAKRNDTAISGQAAVAKYEGEVIRQTAQSESAAVAATSNTVTPATRAYRHAGVIHHSAPSAVSTPAAPKHNFQSPNSGALRVHTTSSATVKTIGGGGGGGAAGGGGGSSTSITGAGSAFAVSTSNMVLSTAAWTSSRSLTAANTMAAEAQVIEATAQEHAAKPGIKKVNGYPDIPFPDPVGDGIWILLALAAAYIVVIIYRRKQTV